MSPLRRVVLVPLLLVALVGCGPGSTDEGAEDGAGRSAADEVPEGPRLAVADPASAYPDALVRGALEVNGSGCFAVEGDVLLAPDGSEVLEDGEGIRIPGLGDIRVGERFESGGGYFEGARMLGDDADCLARPRGGVVLVAPGG